jgi:phage-related protein
MASIFSLFGEVLIDNTNANKSIDDTTKKAENSGSKVGSAFSSIAKGAAVVGTAVVTGAAAVGGAALKMASDTAAAADNIDKMSQKIGISTTTYQEWDYVMSQNGMSVDKLQTGIKTLTSKMDAARNGTASAAEVFGALGISVTNADGSLRSQEEVFEETIAALQGMENETERAQLATELFGKAGVEMAPLLNQTAESTEALKKKAHELGMVMSDDTIKAGVKFTDTMDTLKRSFGGIVNELGGTVIPIVQSVLELILERVPDIQAFFEQFAPIVQELFDGVLPPLFELTEAIIPTIFELLATLIPVIKDIIEAILPVIVNLLQQILPFLVQIIQQVLPLIIQLITALMPLITEVLNAILPVLIELLQAIIPPLIQIAQAVLPVIIELVQTLLPPIIQIVNAIMPVLIQLINTVMPLLVQIIEAILPVITRLLEEFLPPILEVVDMILPALIDLINGVLPLVTSIIEAILPVLISLLDAIMPLMKPILDLLLTLLSPLMDLLNSILPPIISLLKGLIDTVLPPLQKAFEKVATVISTVFKGAFESIEKIIGNIKEAFGGIIKFITGVFTGDWKGAWEGVKSVFSGIVNALVEIFKAPINWIIDGINVFIRGLNKIEIPDWVPVVGGLGFHIKELSRLRIGMEYVPYDEYPALLHKGERVLTESENKEYSKAYSEEKKPEEGKLVVTIQLGERAIYIEHLDGTDEEDMGEFTDRLLEVIAEKIQRKGLVFG